MSKPARAYSQKLWPASDRRARNGLNNPTHTTTADSKMTYLECKQPILGVI